MSTNSDGLNLGRLPIVISARVTCFNGGQSCCLAHFRTLPCVCVGPVGVFVGLDVFEFSGLVAHSWKFFTGAASIRCAPGFGIDHCFNLSFGYHNSCRVMIALGKVKFFERISLASRFFTVSPPLVCTKPTITGMNLTMAHGLPAEAELFEPPSEQSPRRRGSVFDLRSFRRLGLGICFVLEWWW